jgi:hypothetical protein
MNIKDATLIVCPFCHDMLTKTEKAYHCHHCDEIFPKDQFGYFSFLKLGC